MNHAYWLNSAWMWKCRCELAAFYRSTDCVASTQAALLRDIVSSNQSSEFGRAHHFASIGSREDFQRSLPLSDYHAYRSAIEQVGAGAKKVLTTERVRLLEPTSASSGGEKLIPYTAALQAQFQRAIDAWIGDLFIHRPAVRRGRAYWSISPALGGRRKTSAGIPIGFADDSEYLGLLEKLALRRLLVAPPSLAGSANLDNFRYATLFYLIGADDLALISIWSPTFLTAMLAQLDRAGESICRDLSDGTLTLPDMDADQARRADLPLRRDVKRAAQLDAILRSEDSLANKLRRVWPKLALVSCWADGSSSYYLRELQGLFPNTEIQPKGLLATEAFVSLPLSDQPGAALAIRSHFFEFVEADGVTIRLAHELQIDDVYAVVVTTGGGLYRYRLGDRVRVVGFLGQCPLLRFAGRADGVSDLVGEKLHESHVRAVLDRAFSERRLAPIFHLLVPVMEGNRHYCLYVQTDSGSLPHSEVALLKQTVEAGLRQNPYYDHAVRLGQLSSVQIRPIVAPGASGWAVYEAGCLERGQKLGDIKPAALHDWNGWHERFAPVTRPPTAGDRSRANFRV